MAAPFSTSIELRHPRYFVAAAEHGNFRKAGVTLEVKESSISRSVRDLEDEIGVSQFIRHSSGVNLTLAGPNYGTAQVLWCNYKKDVDAWHGALECKKSYQRHFYSQSGEGLRERPYNSTKLRIFLTSSSRKLGRSPSPSDSTKPRILRPKCRSYEGCSSEAGM